MAVTDLVRFREFLDVQIAGRPNLSPEEAVLLWRDENPPDDEDDLQAIRTAVEAFQSGDRGVLASEFLDSLRAEYDLGASA